MGRVKSTTALVGLVCSLALVIASSASAKVPNGNFERGNLSGWATQNSGDSIWHLYGPGAQPPVPLPYAPAAKGQFSLRLETTGESWGVISRTLRVPADARKLKMSIWWKNEAAGGWQPFDDWTNITEDIQDFGVDLLPPTAKATSTKPLVELFAPKTGTPDSSGDSVRASWRPLSVNVTKYRGRKIKLRVIHLTRASYFYLGLDNVDFSN